MRNFVFASLLFLVSCADNIIAPTIIPSPSPIPGPLRAIVNVIATQGETGITTAVLAGTQFKLSATATKWFQDGEVVPGPVLVSFSWRQLNAPAGLCGDAGASNSSTIAVVCVSPTYPETVDFEACAMSLPDNSGNVLNYGCGSYGVYIE